MPTVLIPILSGAVLLREHPYIESLNRHYLVRDLERTEDMVAMQIP